MHDQQLSRAGHLRLLQTFLGFDCSWASTGAGPPASSASTTTRLRAGQPGAGIVLIALLRGGGYLLMMNHEHFYLMGKLLFGFTIFWAYIAFGQ